MTARVIAKLNLDEAAIAQIVNAMLEKFEAHNFIIVEDGYPDVCVDGKVALPQSSFNRMIETEIEVMVKSHITVSYNYPDTECIVESDV